MIYHISIINKGKSLTINNKHEHLSLFKTSLLYLSFSLLLYCLKKENVIIFKVSKSPIAVVSIIAFVSDSWILDIIIISTG